VTGKMNKFFATNCLLEQGFVKNPDISIKDHVASVAQALGDEIAVAKFLRFQIGENF
jgi:elongation factor Ts